MADMWKSRAPPTPLEFDAIRNGTFKLEKDNAQTNGTSDTNRSATNGSSPSAPGSAATEKVLNGAQTASTAKSSLKDQRALTLQDSLELFMSRHVYIHIVPRRRISSHHRQHEPISRTSSRRRGHHLFR